MYPKKNRVHNVSLNREEGYKLSEKQFEQAMENSPIGISLLSLKGKYMRVNQAFCEIVGYLKEELLQMNWKTITYQEDISANKELLDKLLNNQIKTFQMVKRYVHKYGYPVWVQINASLVRDDHNKPDFIIVNIQDITERKVAELELRQNEERYGLVVNNVTDLISIIDSDANYLFCSASHNSVMGYKPKELVGINALSLIHPDDLPHVHDELHKIITGEADIAQFRVRHKDGHFVTLEGRGKAIMDVYGKPYVLVITSQDITERIELEKRKDRFISMTSHELITPLTTLKAYMQILEKQSAKSGKQYHYLEKMREQIEGLALLAKELSDVSRFKNGGMELHPEKFLLDELTTDVAEDLSLISERHDIIFKANSPVEIFADKYRISQVLTNLITNAIKFSPKSRKIIISIVEEFGIAVLKVQDFGIGISKEDQKNIFEAFYQTSNSMVQSRMGLGLGLHIVSQIVKEHRGTIEVKSEVGKGSTFIVHLPMLQRSDKQQNRPGILLAT